VGLDGAEADVEGVGDLSVGLTSGHRDEDFLFTRGEWFDGSGRSCRTSVEVRAE
jgi:hypothetical protein